MKRIRHNLTGKPYDNGENSGRDSQGRFVAGNSYSRGRPPNVRNKNSGLGAQFLDQHQQITSKCIDMALNGNIPALKLCLERLIPVVRDTPVNISLPKIDSVATASQLTATLLDLVSTGAITASQGEHLSRLAERHIKSLQLSDLETRLEQLEQSLIQGQGN